MSTSLIVNPAAGRGAGARLEDDIRAELAAHGVEVEVIRSQGPGDVAARVMTALVTKPERVLVAGGDG
ncbi:MAG: diacylglycerol kinase family protein, partial [Gammaproteobacteria bacterium]